MKAKVTSVVYRVEASSIETKEFDKPHEATIYAYRAIADNNAADSPWVRGVVVQRVVKHEPVDIDGFGAFFGPRTETITGEVHIEAPKSIAFSNPALSYYSPVNGWNVPEEIEV